MYKFVCTILNYLYLNIDGNGTIYTQNSNINLRRDAILILHHNAKALIDCHGMNSDLEAMVDPTTQQYNINKIVYGYKVNNTIT